MRHVNIGDEEGVLVLHLMNSKTTVMLYDPYLHLYKGAGEEVGNV